MQRRPDRRGYITEQKRPLLHELGLASYLTIDRDHMVDLLIETWSHGPER